MTRTNINLLSFLAGIVLMVAIVVMLERPDHTKASVQVGNEYHATTTQNGVFASTTVLTNAFSVGSVIITATTSNVIALYDATTSDITKRNNVSTSSIRIATFPAGEPTGTYPLDALITNGLIISVEGTTLMQTNTITYR